MDTVWLDLLNSDWHDYRGSGRTEDRLDNDEWLDGFLTRWRTELQGVPREEIRRTLRELRTLLKRMIDATTSGRRIARDDWEMLNALMAVAPMVRQLEREQGGYRFRLVPVTEGLNRVRAEIATSFAHVLVHGDPSRIKICENPDCLWTFYDESKNRTRRWCESSGCGNLMKVRRYRARKKEGTDR